MEITETSSYKITDILCQIYPVSDCPFAELTIFNNSSIQCQLIRFTGIRRSYSH